MRTVGRYALYVGLPLVALAAIALGVSLSLVGVPQLPSPMAKRSGAAVVLGLHFAPGSDCTDEAVLRIGQAKTSVRVLAYNFSAERIRDALIAAKKRGVDVQCIVDHVAATERGCIVPALRDADVPCFIDAKHKIAHQKVIVVDGQIICCGSFNWSDSAEKNSEQMLTLYSEPLAAQYLANWELHREHSAEVHQSGFWKGQRVCCRDAGGRKRELVGSKDNTAVIVWIDGKEAGIQWEVGEQSLAGSHVPLVWLDRGEP